MVRCWFRSITQSDQGRGWLHRKCKHLFYNDFKFSSRRAAYFVCKYAIVCKSTFRRYAAQAAIDDQRGLEAQVDT